MFEQINIAFWFQIAIGVLVPVVFVLVLRSRWSRLKQRGVVLAELAEDCDLTMEAPENALAGGTVSGEEEQHKPFAVDNMPPFVRNVLKTVLGGRAVVHGTYREAPVKVYATSPGKSKENKTLYTFCEAETTNPAGLHAQIQVQGMLGKMFGGNDGCGDPQLDGAMLVETNDDQRFRTIFRDDLRDRLKKLMGATENLPEIRITEQTVTYREHGQMDNATDRKRVTFALAFVADLARTLNAERP